MAEVASYNVLTARNQMVLRGNGDRHGLCPPEHTPL